MKCPNCNKIAQVDDTSQIMVCNRCGAEITTLSRKSYVITKPSENTEEVLIDKNDATVVEDRTEVVVDKIKTEVHVETPVWSATIEETEKMAEEEKASIRPNTHSYQTKLPIEGEGKVYALETYDCATPEKHN